MQKLLGLVLLLPSLTFADELQYGPWDLYCGRSICVNDLPTEAACYDAAKHMRSDVTQKFGCRTISHVWIDPVASDPDPTPDPDPEPIPDPIPNPKPSQYRGIPDPSQAIGFDVYADYVASQTITGSRRSERLSCNGTASAPCLIDATAATFEKVTVTGSYVIFQGGQVIAPADRGSWFDIGGCNRCVARNVVVTGPKRDVGHSAAVELGANVVWLGGRIHGFGDNRPQAREQDFHGIKTGGNGPTWILDAEIYDNSGDSVQVGDASRGASNNVFIGGGFFHDNRENGVDIKDSNNIVVSGVRMSGFSPTSSDPGSAIVVHDDAFNAKIYDNVMADCVIGIVSSGRDGHDIDSNVITASSIGIDLRGTTNIRVQNNDINAPTRIRRGGGLSGDIQD